MKAFGGKNLNVLFIGVGNCVSAAAPQSPISAQHDRYVVTWMTAAHELHQLHINHSVMNSHTV